MVHNISRRIDRDSRTDRRTASEHLHKHRRCIANGPFHGLLNIYTNMVILRKLDSFYLIVHQSFLVDL